MFGATNLTCGDWWVGTVMEGLRWVKCPAKTSQALKILIMGKAAIGLHKSHMWRAGRLPARSGHAETGPRALIPGAREPELAECVHVAAHQGGVGACMVDSSVRPGMGARDATRAVMAAVTPARQRAPRRVPGGRLKGAGGFARPQFRVMNTERGALVFGRGQRANFAAVGSGIRGNPWFPDYHSARAGQTRRTCK